MYFGIWFMANCSIIAKNQFWFMIMRQILWAFMFLAHSAARCWAGSGTNYHLAAPHCTTTSLFMVRARRLAVAASMRYARTGDCRQIPHCRNGRFWSLVAVGAIRNCPVQPSFACFLTFRHCRFDPKCLYRRSASGVLRHADMHGYCLATRGAHDVVT